MINRLLFVCLLFCSLPNNTTAQNFQELTDKADRLMMTNIDSSIYYYQMALDQAIAKSDSGKVTFAASGLVSLYHMNKQQTEAIYTTETALAYAVKKKDKAMLMTLLGQVLDNMDLSKSDSLFREAEVIANEIKDSVLFVSLHSNYAGLKIKQGDFYGAIDYLLLANKNTSSEYAHANQYLKIANLFILLKNYDRAEEYILKSKALLEKNNWKSSNGFLYGIYSKNLLRQKKYQQAEQIANLAIEFAAKKENHIQLVQAYNILTEIKLENNQLEAAQQYHDRAWLLADKVPVEYKIDMLVYKNDLLAQQNAYTQIIDNAKTVIEIANEKKLNIPLQSAYGQLYKAYQRINNTDQALYYSEKYHQLRDSLFRSEQVGLINNLEARFNRKAQEDAITLLDTENELQATQLDQKNKLLIGGGIAFLLISGLSFFLFRLFKKVDIQKQQLSKALDEKDILLREIHHRVKNNLQLISSLLGLQSRHISDPSALDAINTGQSRVRSMALIHQDLYNKENLTGVSVKTYLDQLCEELFDTYSLTNENIQLKKNIADLDLDVDTLVPLGLIINELITNALKYAFPDNRAGTIEVNLFQKKDQLNLQIKDDGVGMQPEKKSKNSFGYNLIKTLSLQLDGKMVQETKDGTAISFIFNDYKIAV